MWLWILLGVTLDIETPRPFVPAASDHIEIVSLDSFLIDLSGAMASTFCHHVRSLWASLDIRLR